MRLDKPSHYSEKCAADTAPELSGHTVEQQQGESSDLTQESVTSTTQETIGDPSDLIQESVTSTTQETIGSIDLSQATLASTTQDTDDDDVFEKNKEKKNQSPKPRNRPLVFKRFHSQGAENDRYNCRMDVKELSEQEQLCVWPRNLPSQAKPEKYGKQFTENKNKPKLKKSTDDITANKPPPGEKTKEKSNTPILYWDASMGNMIAVPKSNDDTQLKVDKQLKVDHCLNFIDHIKTKKQPSGVVLDATKISLSPGKEYRENHEYKQTGEVLGKGVTGDIVVLKDLHTDTEHALKTMMSTWFKKEEIKCWMAMDDSGFVPHLYFFQIVGNKVFVHMEILRNALTLRSIIDGMLKFNPSLVKPFSLFVYEEVLKILKQCYHNGWLHRDLHAGNVMVQTQDDKTLHVKILDFGNAQRLGGSTHELIDRGFMADIAEAVRLLLGLYIGQECENAKDVEKQGETYIKSVSKNILNADNKEELCLIVRDALKIKTVADLDKHIEKLSRAKPSEQMEVVLYNELDRETHRRDLASKNEADVNCQNNKSSLEIDVHDIDQNQLVNRNSLLNNIMNYTLNN